MKRLLSIALLLIAAVCAAAELTSKQYLFDGQWMPATSAEKVGAKNFITLSNLMYSDDGLRGVPGYSKINTTALTTYTKIRSGHQLRTDRTTPSLVLLQAHDVSGNSVVYQNQGTIPNQHDFETTALHTDSSGASVGRFADSPTGIVYCNGVDPCQTWDGPEKRVDGFYVVSDISVTDNDIALNNAAPDTIVATAGSFLDKGFKAGQTITITGAATAGNNVDQIIQTISADGLTLTLENPGNFVGTDAAGASTVTVACNGTTEYVNPVDYTDAVNNELTTAGNLAILGGGDDGYTKLLLHMNGTDTDTTFTDDSDSAHSPTAVGNFQLDTAVQKFGTASGLGDGIADYLSITDSADFYYASGKITIDKWVNFASLGGIQVLYEQDELADGDKAVLYFYNNALFLYVTEARAKLINETVAWTPSLNTQYHLAVVRGWGGVADDWAITVNGTAIHTFTNASAWSNYPNVVTIGGSLNSNFFDVGATRHLVEANGTITVTPSTVKFGDGSITADGASGYLQIPDHANFDVIADTVTSWTIDFWVKHTGPAGTEHYIGQRVNADNQWEFIYITGTGLVFRNYEATVLENNLSGGEITDNNWHHVAWIKDGQAMGVYLDGAQVSYDAGGDTATYAGDIGIAAAISATSFFDGQLDEVRVYQGNPFGATGANAPNVGLTSTITPPTAEYTPDANTKLLIHGDTKSLDGWLDEFRISKGIARWTADFTVPVRAYQETQRKFYTFSTRPLQGLTLNVSNANTVSASLVGYQWTGKSFSTMSLTDGTDPGTGVSMGQTGTVSFTSTENTAQPWHFEGLYLYAYLFTLSDGGAEISYVTEDAPFQPIVDIWDGVYRQPIVFQAYDASDANWDDWTLAVNLESDNQVAIGAELHGMTVSDYIFVGFDDRMAAIYWAIIGERANDATASPTIYYWSGTNWVTVGTIFDSTTHERALKSLSQTGLMAWAPPAEADEAKQTLFGKTGYFYKVSFSNTLNGTGSEAGRELVVDLITGIPAQYTVPPFVFPSEYKNQLFLFNYAKGKEGSRADFSMSTAPDVWNGDLSSMNGLQSLYFGDSSPVVAAGQVYNRYGSSVITGLLVLKKAETLMLTGDSPEDYKIFPVSENIGCVAPLTLASAEMGYELGADVPRNVMMWLSHAGPVIFDGAILKPLQGVDNFFDPANSECVNWSVIDKSWGVFDPLYTTYYLGIPSGASATGVNKILAYHLKYKKWFEVAPSTYMQAAWPVIDSNGVRYLYGGIDTGYMLRLNHGTSWAGDGITQTVETGDFFPYDNSMIQSRLRRLQVVAARIDEDVDLSIYHYADTANDDSTVDMTMALDAGTNRVVRQTGSFDSESHWSHRLKFEATTSSTEKGVQLKGWQGQFGAGHSEW